MQRITTSAALVFAGALLLSACTTGGGTATPSADPCEAVLSEVRDISNGAQNTLNRGGTATEVQATLETYSQRVAALEETASGDAAVSEALVNLEETLAEAANFALTIPTDPAADIDPEALAEQQQNIAEAASDVTVACGSPTGGPTGSPTGG